MRHGRKEKLPYLQYFLVIYLPYVAIMTLLATNIPDEYLDSAGNQASVQNTLFSALLIAIPSTFPVAYFLSSTVVRVKGLKQISSSLFGVPKTQRRLKWAHIKEVHTQATVSYPVLEFDSSFSPQCEAAFSRWRERYLDLARSIFEVTAMPDSEVIKASNSSLLVQLEEKAKKLEAATVILKANNDEYWDGKIKPDYEQSGAATETNPETPGTASPAEASTSGADPNPDGGSEATAAAISKVQASMQAKKKTGPAEKIQFDFPVQVTAVASPSSSPNQHIRRFKRLWVPPSPTFNIYVFGLGLLASLIALVVCAYLAPEEGTIYFQLRSGKQSLLTVTWAAVALAGFVTILIMAIPAYFSNLMWRQHKRNKAEEAQLQRIMTSVTNSVPLLGLEVEMTADKYPQYADVLRRRYNAWTEHVDKAQDVTGFGDDTRNVDNTVAFAVARALRLEANSLWRVRQMIEGDVQAWRQDLSWWSLLINRKAEFVVSADNSFKAIIALKKLEQDFLLSIIGSTLRGLNEGYDKYPVFAATLQMCGAFAKQEQREELITLPTVAQIDVKSGILSAFFTSNSFNKILEKDEDYRHSVMTQAFASVIIAIVYLGIIFKALTFVM